MLCAPVNLCDLQFVAQTLRNAPSDLLQSLRDFKGNIHFHRSSIWIQLQPPTNFYRTRTAKQIIKVIKRRPELWHELCESLLAFHNWTPTEAQEQFSFLIRHAKIHRSLRPRTTEFLKTLPLITTCFMDKENLVNLRIKDKPISLSVVDTFFSFLRTFSIQNSLPLHFASPRAYMADNEELKIGQLTTFASHFISIPSDVWMIIIPHLTSRTLPNGEEGLAHFILLICDVLNATVQIYDPMGDILDTKYIAEAEVLVEALNIYGSQKVTWEVEKLPFLSIRQQPYSKDCCPAICFTARLIAALLAEGREEWWREVNELSYHMVKKRDFVAVREYLGDAVTGYSNCTTARSKEIFSRSEAGSWETLRNFVQSVQ